jgi:hypothetical protein
VPKAALAKLNKFEGPHFINRTIDSQRTATTWVGNDAIWGGEFTSRTKDTGNKTQFHPATVQWRMPSGEIGWMKLTHSPNIDAVADRGGITVATDGDVTFRIFSGPEHFDLSEGEWRLPGFDVSVQTDAKSFSTNKPDDCAGCVDVTYGGIHSLRLNMRTKATR